MEETVCACRYRLVAVDAARTDDAYWRLRVLHDASLNARRMRTQQNILGNVVRMLAYEECVLHVASRMVGSKVHLGKHVHVVLHLRSVSQDKAHA